MRILALGVAGLTLIGCDYMPGMSPRPQPPSTERVDAFVVLVEGAGCTLHQSDNDVLLDPAGFDDAEASAISQALLAQGRAEITPEGNLLLLTENCL